MDRRKELPEIEIAGHPWIVDVDGHRIIDIEDSTNIINASDMRYSEQGYSFLYNQRERNIGPDLSKTQNFELDRKKNDLLYVQIPNFIVMDPEGVSERYGWQVEELEGKIDCNILVDRKFYVGFNDINSIVEDGVFEESILHGKKTIEIPIEDFMCKKFELYAEIIKATPALQQQIEAKNPGTTKKIDEIIAWHKRSQRPPRDSDIQPVKQKQVRKRGLRR